MRTASSSLWMQQARRELSLCNLGAGALLGSSYLARPNRRAE